LTEKYPVNMLNAAWTLTRSTDNIWN